jgi:hypothetical protein
MRAPNDRRRRSGYVLRVPRAVLNNERDSNARRARAGREVQYLVLHVRYPDFGPDSMVAKPSLDSLRIDIGLTPVRSAPADDGLETLLDFSRGVNALTNDGWLTTQPVPIRRFMSQSEEAFSFLDTHGRTVFLRCLRSGTTCSAVRTWRRDIRLHYQFDRRLIGEWITVDRRLTSWIDAMFP